MTVNDDKEFHYGVEAPNRTDLRETPGESSSFGTAYVAKVVRTNETLDDWNEATKLIDAMPKQGGHPDGSLVPVMIMKPPASASISNVASEPPINENDLVNLEELASFRIYEGLARREDQANEKVHYKDSTGSESPGSALLC